MKKRLGSSWVAYSIEGHINYHPGRATQSNESSTMVIYTERQEYPAQCWSNKYVRFFDDVIQLARFLAEDRIGCDFTGDDVNNIIDEIRRMFPSLFKQEKENGL